MTETPGTKISAAYALHPIAVPLATDMFPLARVGEQVAYAIQAGAFLANAPATTFVNAHTFSAGLSLVGRATIPAITAGKGPFLLDNGDNSFNGTPDPTLYFGYNQRFNGAKILAGENSLSMAIEADYNDGASRLMEFYLQYASANGLVGHRPIALQINRVTNVVDSFFLSAPTIKFADDPGGVTAVTYQFSRNNMTILAVDAALSSLNILAAAGATAMLNLGFNAVPSVFQIYLATANQANLTVGGALVGSWFGYTAGLYALSIGVQDTAAGLTVQVGSGHTAGKGIVARGRSGQTGSLFEAHNSASVVLFGIKANGDIMTSRSAAATTPGSIVKKLELFDGAGASLGFVPIYGAIT